MEKIVIFGAGGHGKVILDILIESKRKVHGFIDGDPKKMGQKIRGYKVLGDASWLKKNSGFVLALGIGNNIIREKIFMEAKKLGISIVTAIHPRSVIAKDVTLGEGAVVMPNAVINTGTRVGEGVIINTGATVDHDCTLKRFCEVHPGAHLAGTVEVGEFSYIGAGSVVIQNITIGSRAIIGAGAAVVKNIPDRVTAVGVPAKVIKRHS